MKKFVIVLCALLASCGGLLSASYQNLNVINITQLSDRDLNEIMLGQHPEVAVEFSAQTLFPLSMIVIGDLLNLTEKNIADIEVKQTFYVRRIEDRLLFSANLVDWKPLLEFITGYTSFSISIEEGKPLLSIGAEAQLRS